jgi:PAS domain S-box-containing protein
MYFRFVASIAIMVCATFLVMMMAGREVLHQYAFRYTEQMGNTRVAEIGEHIVQTEMLAQAVAHRAGRSIGTRADLAREVETVLAALGYTGMLAGAEVWVERGALPPGAPQVFAWTGNGTGRLARRPVDADTVFPPWYDVARAMPEGKVVWSETVADPETKRVGMKGYVPIVAEGTFLGVAVVDVDLTHLRPLLSELPSPAGYSFTVDRTNRPIFDPPTVGYAAPSLGGRAAFVAMFSRVDGQIRATPRSHDEYQRLLEALPAAHVTNHGYAALTLAMLLDVLAAPTADSKLLLREPLKHDPVLEENSQVFIFHVPRTYWKLVMVKPESAIMAPTRPLALKILALLILIMVVPLAVVFLLIRRDIGTPVRHMSRSLMELSDTQGNPVEALGGSAVNELVGLAYAFNRRTEALRDANVHLRREIEGRVRTETALRDSEARFRNVLENTRDLLYKLNLQTRQYDYVSPACHEITGFSAEELAAMGPDEIVDRIHPEDRPFIKQHFRKLLAAAGDDAGSSHIEYRWRHRNGSYVWASENRTLLRDEHGQAVALIGSARDVTGRKQAEREVLQVRQYLQSIIDSMPSVLIGVDHACRVTHWNKQAADVTGRAAEHVLGQPFYHGLSLRDDQVARVCEAVSHGQPLESERFRIAGADGNERHVELIVYPLIADGVEGAVIRVDDVSARVQIEEMMVQTEKMMSVGGLAAGMAHEINNPLGGILQACQNIERRTSPELPKNHQVAHELGVTMSALHAYMERRKILEFIQGIRADGTRAAKIIADMLAFSRRSESKFVPVHFPHLIDTVIRLAANDYDLKKHYDFKRIKIVRQFDPEVEVIRCDRSKMEQVLLNLIKNSAQAMAFADRDNPNPTLTIQTAQENHHVRIDIADNGPGMDEQTRRRAFEPFFTTKEVGVGTGLGLSVSYFIITKQHKGTMSVESAPGKGARFIIRLPIDGKE